MTKRQEPKLTLLPLKILKLVVGGGMGGGVEPPDNNVKARKQLD